MVGFLSTLARGLGYIIACAAFCFVIGILTAIIYSHKNNVDRPGLVMSDVVRELERLARAKGGEVVKTERLTEYSYRQTLYVHQSNVPAVQRIVDSNSDIMDAELRVSEEDNPHYRWVGIDLSLSDAQVARLRSDPGLNPRGEKPGSHLGVPVGVFLFILLMPVVGTVLWTDSFGPGGPSLPGMPM